jgi:hypothetical protein
VRSYVETDGAVSETLRSFRRNAVHVRQALDILRRDEGHLEVEGGYLQDTGQIERYKRLSIPVRRALNDNDRASFSTAAATLADVTGAPADVMARATEAWRALQTELDGAVVLGGTRVERRKILAGWLEAAAFYDKLERDRAYDHLVDQWGKAAEGMGSQLMEDAAAAVLLLDEAAAAALGEPVILPPPVKTPPPPPDPKESWWRRLFGSRVPDAD